MKESGFCYLHLEAKLMGIVGAPRLCCLNSAGWDGGDTSTGKTNGSLWSKPAVGLG